MIRKIILTVVLAFFTAHAELLSCNNGQACPSPFVCQNGTCRYQQPVSCEDNGACPPGLFCYGLLPSCSPPPNPLACDQDGKCPLGFGCFQGVCLSQPLSPCGQNNVCNPGFSCNNGTCVPLKTCPIPPTPVARPGCNIITTWNEETGCPTSECIYAKMNYQTCNNVQECLQWFVCQDGTCQFYYNISCHDNADCPQGTTCMANQCTPPPLPFECDKDGKCPRGLRCLQGFCTSLPWSPCGEGGACNYNTHCVNGTCVPSISCPFPTIPKVKKGCQMETAFYSPSQCPKLIENCEKCPKNSAFQGCSNFCGPITCSNFNPMSPCYFLRCGTPRCQCNYGYVQLTDNIQDGCVKPKDCPKAKSS